MKKRLSILTIFFFLFFIFFSIKSIAKEMPTNIGLYGGLGFNMHSPSFTDTAESNQVLIPFNQSSTALSGYFGIIGNFPINETYTISGRIGYYNLNGSISSTTVTEEKHTLDARFQYIEVSPILQLHNLISNSPIYFLAGLEFGFPLSMKYDYKYENLNTPSLNSTITDIDLRGKATRLAVALGVGYILNLSENTFLMPEASFRLPLTKVSTEKVFDSWNISQLRLGVNLTFGLNKYEEPITIKKDEKYLNVNTPEIVYYDAKMTPRPVEKVKVEEVQYTELFPLIPYVFFPEGKSTPAPETQVLAAQNEAGEFRIDALSPSAEKINSYTLDIIGSRLKQDNTAQITVTGTLNSKELKSQKSLAKERADFVKNYLVANYGIQANKINTIAGGFPAKPSSKSDVDGDKENSRAEIASNNPEILKPIVISSDKERITVPQLIDFKSIIATNDTIDTWVLKYFQAGKEIEKKEGFGMPSNISWQILPNQLASSQTPVDWEFTVKTINGLKKTINGSLPVDYFSFTRKKTENLPDKIISKFSLVLFDFDSPSLSDQDKQIIDKYVIPSISANSTIQIYGYTDRIGDEDYNKNLATKRADNVRKYLEGKVKNVAFETYGVGESVLIFNNNLTTGRQLSRTVQIYVITPKK
jgi:outer membrane protein OmpA-like peptidoglycan-associated protein